MEPKRLLSWIVFGICLANVLIIGARNLILINRKPDWSWSALLGWTTASLLAFQLAMWG